MISRKAFLAYAHAVNLRAADVPKLAGHRLIRGSETKSGPLGPVDHCDGGVAPASKIIGISSQRFERNNARKEGPLSTDSLLPIESMHSTVYLMQSAALASQEVAAADSNRARACLKRLIVRENPMTSSEGSTVEEPIFTHIEVSALPSPLWGVRAYGLRMTADSAFEVPGTKGRSNDYEDFLGFVMGSTVITLNDTGDPHPFPSMIERRLLLLEAVSQTPGSVRRR